MMKKECIQKSVSNNTTWSGVLRDMGLPVHGGNIENIKKKVLNYGIDVSHFTGRPPSKYTKEFLQDVVSKSISYAEMCRYIGVKCTGGMLVYLQKRIKEYEIDTGHLLGKRANSGVRHRGHKMSVEEILSKRNDGKRTDRIVLKRALIKTGREYKCEQCGLKEWNGKELKLQIHHKNKDSSDNTPSNIEQLCPNCHSQTDNWCNCKAR